MLDTHCKAAFMKQVFPRLFNPVAPGSVGTDKETDTIFYLINTLALINAQ